MKLYFTILSRIWQRKLRNWGIEPIVFWILAPVVFVGLAWMLYQRLQIAPIVLGLLALQGMMSLGTADRNEFLRTIYPIKKYRMLRAIENLLVALPFMLVMLYHGDFYYTMALIALSVLSSTIVLKSNLQFVFPSPFGRELFEFSQGFRRSFGFAILLVLGFAIGVATDNFNLYIFSIALLYLSMANYYRSIEPEYYVWTYALSPSRFLYKKIKQLVLNSCLLTLPVSITACIYYPHHYTILLALYIAGTSYIVCSMLAKYASYPDRLSLPYGILLAISIILVPLLLPLSWYFYTRAVRNLSPPLA